MAKTKKAPPYPGYLSPAELLKLAQQAVAAEVLPQQQEVARQREAAGQRQAEQAKLLQGLTLAAAEILKGAGPQTAATYQTGARDQATFAKGFSDGMKMLTGASGEKTNDFLTNVVGAPEGQLVKPNQQSDVLYGLGGYIPASSMEREGAAFGAAADRLPATAIGRGQMDIAALLKAGAAADAGFDTQLRDLEARRPGLIQQALQTLQSQELQKQATAIQAAYLANTQTNTQASITGYYLGADGKLHPTFANTSTTATRNAKAKAAADAKAAKQQAARDAAVKNRSGAISDAEKVAFQRAQEYRGTPEENPSPGRYVRSGKYLSKPGQSEFKDGTTNDPKRALRENAKSWQEASQLIYSEIAGDLKRRYGLKDAAIRRIVRERLIAAGWKPPAAPRPVPTGTESPGYGRG